MEMTESLPLLKALADRSRLLVASCLLERPHYVEELARRLALAPSTVSFHLRKLEEVGLVRSTKEQYYVTYHLDTAPLKRPLLDLLRMEDPERAAQEERLEHYRRKVLDTFLKGGRLTRIPAQRKKRYILLQEIVRSFRAGRRYAESEVNRILVDFHDDVCTLRREMIIEKLMLREKGEYWLADEATREQRWKW